MQQPIHVIGGGLAGTEAAWQIATAGPGWAEIIANPLPFATTHLHSHHHPEGLRTAAP